MSQPGPGREERRDATRRDAHVHETVSATEAISRGALPPVATRPKSNPHVSPRWPLWLLIFLFVLVVVRITVPYLTEQVSYSIARGKQRAAAEAAETELDSLRLEDLSKAYQAVSDLVAPSVVHIQVEGYAPAGQADEFGWMFRRDSHEGSGVIVDVDGFILTNAHVVQGATDITVALSDGRHVAADIVGVDALTDLAVLHTVAAGLIPAKWGNSDELNVGALVWAVGSPFGLQQSITFGIVSAKNRGGMTSEFQDFLQTDAAVNPGNSGGPLVNARGQVVGINTAIVGESYQGISFSIPSNVAQDVYKGLRRQGRVERGWVGVGIDNVSPELAQRQGLTSPDGAVVVNVHMDPQNPSPAEQAGLRRDDVLLQWNDKPVRDATSFSLMVAQTDPGTTVDVLIVRRGEQLRLKVTVGRRPPRL